MPDDLSPIPPCLETQRLRAADRRLSGQNWKRWGPYLSERQWGTVREDYTPDGNSWGGFTHDDARSRAYRWGEDGLLGFTDRECRLCFAVALWNGRDPILKERLFGLTGPEGNHGEDVKELYYYLDSTPTHSYARALYKYPQAEYPYSQLTHSGRTKLEPEYEITDTGVFAESRYFDVEAEYAKAAPDDLLVRVTVTNRGPARALLHLLPTFWFRNTWTWGCTHEGCWAKPRLLDAGDGTILAEHVTLGRFRFAAAPASGAPAAPEWLFTENETNHERLDGHPSSGPFRKDAFHEYLIHGQGNAVQARRFGTKAAAHYVLVLEPGAAASVPLRLWEDRAAPEAAASRAWLAGFDAVFAARRAEADAFYAHQIPATLDDDERNVMRQAYAGLLWSKQMYHYVVKDWLDGDPAFPPPPASRKQGRNREWRHLFNRDVISMPDKWEYPWYAAWDLAFHMVSYAHLDPQFAKDQLLLLLREWYMHPNGQIPAYEFALGDVNPPVHAWACWRVYKLTGPRGHRDREFLERAFHKLLLNFTWWVNRKDVGGRNLFTGGFLGLDNIGVFDRSQPLAGGQLEQADGTAWMAFYCLTMLAIAFELASADPVYEDVASKFFEHFVAIADAINHLDGTGLWDEQDGFYYDHLRINEQAAQPLRIRSMVGVIPLFAVMVLDQDLLDRLPGFKKRMEWFLHNRTDLMAVISCMSDCTEPVSTPAAAGRSGGGADEASRRRLLAVPSRARLERIFTRLFDEQEFLSPYGVRSLSRAHARQPFVFRCDGTTHTVSYVPGESESSMFGGNSNWRGPVWFPVNFLLVEALEQYHHFYGTRLLVEFPAGSGNRVTLLEAARQIERRLVRLFLRDESGRRPFLGDCPLQQHDPAFRDLLLFHEYFHGDTGRGLGASHQTGWTALVANLLDDVGRERAARGA